MAHRDMGVEIETSPRKITYSSKLIGALTKFASAISHEVKNPLFEKYGDAYDFVVQGDAHRHREEYENAIRAYERAIAVNPDYIEAYMGMGQAFRRKGDIKRAIFSFSKIIKLNAFHKGVHLELAKAYSEAGLPDKAIVHFRQSVKLNPECVESRFHLALSLELEGELQEPCRLYEEIIQLDVEFLPAYNNLGSVHMRLGHYDVAESMFRVLLQKEPGFGRAYLGLAISLDRQNKPKEALRYYEQLLAMRSYSRNKTYVRDRVLTLRQQLGRKPISTQNGSVLVRVK